MLACGSGKDLVCKYLKLLSGGVLRYLFNYYYVLLADAYYVILGLVGNERGYDLVGNERACGKELYNDYRAEFVACEVKLVRLYVYVAGENVVKKDILDKGALVVFSS